MEYTAVAGCFARTFAFVHVAPVLSEAIVPARARMALAALLALVLAPGGAVRAGDLLPVQLALEAASGLVLGLALALPWATVSAMLPQLASSAGLDDEGGENEPLPARLAAVTALACFLALDGEGFLLTMLAAPGALSASIFREGSASLAELAVQGGTALLALLATGLLPFLVVMAAARVAAVLVSRAATMDLSVFHPPVLALAGFVLVLAFTQAAPLLHEGALREGAALTAAPRKGGAR